MMGGGVHFEVCDGAWRGEDGGVLFEVCDGAGSGGTSYVSCPWGLGDVRKALPSLL